MATIPQDERLACLIEELGESLQIIGKIQRHGWESLDPTDRARFKPTNRQMLTAELGHVLAAIQMMELAGDIAHQQALESKQQKFVKLQKWLHHPVNIELCTNRWDAAETTQIKRCGQPTDKPCAGVYGIECATHPVYVAAETVRPQGA